MACKPTASAIYARSQVFWTSSSHLILLLEFSVHFERDPLFVSANELPVPVDGVCAFGLVLEFTGVAVELQLIFLTEDDESFGGFMIAEGDSAVVRH